MSDEPTIEKPAEIIPEPTDSGSEKTFCVSQSQCPDDSFENLAGTCTKPAVCSTLFS